MIERDDETSECLLFLSSSNQSGAFLLLRLVAVLIQQLEQLHSSILIQHVRELGNGGWNLKMLVQNCLFPVEADVFGPFDETREVSLGSDVLAWGPS